MIEFEYKIQKQLCKMGCPIETKETITGDETNYNVGETADEKMVDKPKRSYTDRIMRMKTFHQKFTHTDNIHEGHLYAQDLMKYQVDITCLSELNINLNNHKMRNPICNIF